MALSLAAARSDDGPALHHLAAVLRAWPAVAIHDLQSTESSGLLALAMDLLADGIILTDASSRVLYMNRRARRLVSHGLLSVRSGGLHTAVPQETQRLQKLIAASVAKGGTNAHLRIGARLCLTIVVLETLADHHAGCAAMIVLRDLKARHGPPSNAIVAYFGLTPAEARLASEIVKGDGLTRCARRLGIQVTTARSHLARIFEKTETRRQADLVRLLLSCGSGIVAPEISPGALPADEVGWSRSARLGAVMR